MTESRAGARRHVPGYVSALAGASAGLVAGIAVCPLDVVKTRLQVQGMAGRQQIGGLRGSVWSTLVQISQNEGLRGLYSGLGPLCVGYLPSWAIYFYVYKTTQKHWNSSVSYLGPSVTLPEWSSSIGSAVAAGVCSTMATNPIWMIKTRMMTQSATTSWRYNSVIDAARTIYRVEGWRAFYSGLGSALLGLPHVAIQFPLYERMKRRWAPQRQWNGILAASIASKILASTITYPHEVVRSRNQIRSEGNKYRGIWRTVRTIWIEEGWTAFYSGLTANVCRAIPSSAVTLLTFELVSAYLAKYYAEKSTSGVSLPDRPVIDSRAVGISIVSDLEGNDQLSMPANPLIDGVSAED